MVFQCGVLSLIFEILNGSSVKFVELAYLIFDAPTLFLRSWMGPHVIYGSAVLFLGLSRGIGSCM